MGKIKKILYMAKLVFLEKMAYAKALWVDIVAVMATILIYYFLWQVVYKKNSSPTGFTAAQMTTYVILSKILASQFTGGINRQFMEWIYNGNIGNELVRPISLFWNLFSRRVGEFGFYIIFKAIPVMILGFVILGGEGPAGIVNLILFFVSVCISIVLMFYFEMLVGMGSVFTLSFSAWGFVKQAVFELLSGGIVPLAMFPDALERVINIMPFAGMVSIPVNIYLGKYSIQETMAYIAMQIGWCVVMYLITKVCYDKALKKVIVQGG